MDIFKEKGTIPFTSSRGFKMKQPSDIRSSINSQVLKKANKNEEIFMKYQDYQMKNFLKNQNVTESIAQSKPFNPLDSVRKKSEAVQKKSKISKAYSDPKDYMLMNQMAHATKRNKTGDNTMNSRADKIGRMLRRSFESNRRESEDPRRLPSQNALNAGMGSPRLHKLEKRYGNKQQVSSMN